MLIVPRSRIARIITKSCTPTTSTALLRRQTQKNNNNNNKYSSAGKRELADRCAFVSRKCCENLNAFPAQKNHIVLLLCAAIRWKKRRGVIVPPVSSASPPNATPQLHHNRFRLPKSGAKIIRPQGKREYTGRRALVPRTYSDEKKRLFPYRLSYSTAACGDIFLEEKVV